MSSEQKFDCTDNSVQNLRTKQRNQVKLNMTRKL